MSKRQLLFILLIAFVFLTASGVPNSSLDSGWRKDSDSALIVGRNVNMVSGTTFPDGDPYLQRQNEPSIAVSTRNPVHLLAGANDYRTIDMPFDFVLPGMEEEKGTAQARDAWLGVFKSFDGGQSWISTLLPGYPQDPNCTPPLWGYHAAADPVVRAGTNGLFYYCGIAFLRDKSRSTVFVARFIDNNNMEGKNTIKYIDTNIVQEEPSGTYFIDKPCMAVDIPRHSGTIVIDGQEIPRANVYVAYTAFSGSGEELTSKIRFAVSKDCGQTWNTHTVISALEFYILCPDKKKSGLIQGATIGIDPRKGDIYVAWRQFGSKKVGTEDAIYVTKSTNGGRSFSDPVRVAKIDPFDQGTSFYSFRTNSYPAITVDNTRRAYIAWATRIGVKKSRIVISTSEDGEKWKGATAIDNKGEGHQFMPSLIFAAGKIMAVWYDQRDDIAQQALGKQAFAEYIEDSRVRHTIDIRIAQADPAKNPKFSDSQRVSRYLYIIDDNGQVKQVEFNPPNYPLFQQGTVPFQGDYVDITTQMFIPTPSGGWTYNLAQSTSSGGWAYNSAPSLSTVFHTVWTDNRDVRPPGGNWWGDWENYQDWPLYNAPNSEQDPGYKPPDCANALNTGMRNQNIYTARITSGIIAGSLGNTKPADDVQHTYIVFVKNTTSELKSFRLIINAPNASFRQNLEYRLSTLDVEIPPYSTVTRTVFVDPPQTQIRVDVVEINEPGGRVIPGGLTDSILLNPDPTNPPVYDPTSNPNYPEDLYYEYHNPRVENPRVENYDLGAEGEMNPRVLNPRVENTLVLNPTVITPRVENLGLLNPRVENISFLNPEMENPRVENPRVENTAMADVVSKVGNNGNTTSTYTLTMLSNAVVYDDEGNPSIPDEDIITQILVYKIHTTPVGDGCDLREEHSDELLLNVTNPRVENPRVWNPRVENPRVENPRVENPRVENATFALAPGEEAYVIWRIWDDNAPSIGTTGGLRTANANNGGLSIEDITGPVTDGVPEGAGAALSAHAANYEDVKEGIYDPPVAISANVAPEIGYSPSSLEFEAIKNGEEESLDLSIQNSGEGILDYTLSIEYKSGANWLEIDLNEGEHRQHTAGNPANTHVVTVHPSVLSAAGTYEADIVIEAPFASNSPQRVSVTLTIKPVVTFTISGTVSWGEGGLEGVTMNGFPGETTVTTDGNGDYSGTVDYGWTGTITPEKTGFTFDPTSIEYTEPVTSNLENQTYSVFTIPSYTISGTVSGNLEGVLMSGFPGTVTTASNGTYSATVDYGWDGTVTPEKAGFTFTPSSRTYSNVTEDKLDQDYTPTAITTPEIWRSPSSMTFLAAEGGANPSSQTLEVKNSGGDTLSYTITDDAGWLSVLPASGTSTGDPANTHTVSVDISGLLRASSPYTATITITDPGASNTPQTVSVTLTIYYIMLDEHNSSMWFGGDNRPDSQPRNVGVGQSIILPSKCYINSVGFKFMSSFDYAYNPDGHGHEVTLVLNVRSSDGTISKTVEKIVPATFEGGWVDFDIEQFLEPETYIFTCYLKDGEINHYYTAVWGHSDNTKLPNSNGYSGQVYPGQDIENWEFWWEHTWDFNFRIR